MICWVVAEIWAHRIVDQLVALNVFDKTIWLKSMKLNKYFMIISLYSYIYHSPNYKSTIYDVVSVFRAEAIVTNFN